MSVISGSTPSSAAISSAALTSVLPCPNARLIVSFSTVARGRARSIAAHDPVDAVVDVGEVEHLVVAAVDRDRLAARELVHEERQHALHPLQVVVEAAVDVREAEDEVAAGRSTSRTSR